MEAIRYIKYLKYLWLVITVPDGYYGLREPGNICDHKGIFYYISTCVRPVNGKIEYSLHYWTILVSEVKSGKAWDYKGKIKMNGHGEDGHLIFIDDMPNIFYEDKDAEENGKFEIKHDIAYSIDSTFYFIEKYTPGDTGIAGCLGVYSWLSKNAYKAYSDYRTVKGSSTVVPEENIGEVERDINDKWGKLKPIILAKDFGYDSFGVGGSSFEKLDANYDILETAGLLDYGKSTMRWVNGLMERDRRTNKWKILNKELKDANAKITRASFFKAETTWYAMCTRDGVSMYLAKLITKGGEPSNGGSMKAPYNLKYNPNTRTLSWDYSGVDVDIFDIVAEHNPPDNWIGHADNPNRIYIVPAKYVKGDTQFFQVVAVKKGSSKGFSKPLVIDHVGTVDPLPEPNFNKERVLASVNKVRTEMEVIIGSVNNVRAEMNEIENEVNKA